MSEEKISLELLGARVLTLTAEVRDLRHRLDGLERRMTALEHRFTALEDRFSAMEHRISAMEERFAVQEERMSAMLAVIVRVAEWLDGTPGPEPAKTNSADPALSAHNGLRAAEKAAVGGAARTAR